MKRRENFFQKQNLLQFSSLFYPSVDLSLKVHYSDTCSLFCSFLRTFFIATNRYLHRIAHCRADLIACLPEHRLLHTALPVSTTNITMICSRIQRDSLLLTLLFFYLQKKSVHFCVNRIMRRK